MEELEKMANHEAGIRSIPAPTNWRIGATARAVNRVVSHLNSGDESEVSFSVYLVALFPHYTSMSRVLLLTKGPKTGIRVKPLSPFFRYDRPATTT